MANEYSKKRIIDDFDSGRPYQRSCVNYNGTTEGIPYIEIIAEHILKSKNGYDVQKYVCNRKSFKHKPRKDDITKGTEKHLCRKWYLMGDFFDSKITEELGTPFECELNIVNNTKVNVDLVSYLREESTLYLIEVKGTRTDEGDTIITEHYDTNETLLRCALEIETYWESLEPRFSQMIQDLSASARRKKVVFGDVTKVRVKKAILIPSGTHAEEQFNHPEIYKNVHALLKKWDIKVVIFDKDIKLPQ